jgi:hypothetical protein
MNEVKNESTSTFALPPDVMKIERGITLMYLATIVPTGILVKSKYLSVVNNVSVTLPSLSSVILYKPTNLK